MHIPGHLAVGLAQHHLPTLAKDKKTLAILLTASLFPDAVDKTLGYALHVMPNGRHYAHNIFSLIGTSLTTTLLLGKKNGYAWFVGYLGHLLADNSRFMPWFFPVRSYHFARVKFKFNWEQFLKESLFLLLVLLIFRWARR